MGQKLTDYPHASKSQITVWQLKCGENSLLLEGKVEGLIYQITVNTEASCTYLAIIRPPCKYVITAAAGEIICISGEMLVNIEIKVAKTFRI